MRRVWVWLQLRRGCRPGGRMQLLRGVRLNFHDVERLRHDISYVLNDRLWRGQRVRGRVRAAGGMYV